jgi:hypothetical protein
MMMRILEAGGLPPLTDGIRTADRDNPNGYYEFEPVKQTARDAAWLAQAEGRAVKLVYLLLRDLPRDRPYRVVFMQRALKEVVASQARMLDRLGSQTRGPDDPRTLVAAFAAEIAATKAWLKGEPGFQVLYMNYNRLLAEPRDQLSTLQAFLSGPGQPLLDLDAMCGVIDPTLYRQRADATSNEGVS